MFWGGVRVSSLACFSHSTADILASTLFGCRIVSGNGTKNAEGTVTGLVGMPRDWFEAFRKSPAVGIPNLMIQFTYWQKNMKGELQFFRFVTAYVRLRRGPPQRTEPMAGCQKKAEESIERTELCRWRCYNWDRGDLEVAAG